MKIGDKVLCVGGSSKMIVPGNEYIVDGFSCCTGCGLPTIFLKGHDEIVQSICNKPKGCGGVSVMRQTYWKGNFILPDLESLHAHRVEVSAKELTEIKTIQLQ